MSMGFFSTNAIFSLQKVCKQSFVDTNRILIHNKNAISLKTVCATAGGLASRDFEDDDVAFGTPA